MRRANAGTPHRLIGSEGGYSVAFWTAFFSVVMLPLLALGIGVGRHARAAGEVQKAADLAALAAVREVDLPHFQETGEIRLLRSAVSVAQAYVNMNAGYLAANGIRVRVAGIAVDDASRTVTVRAEADVSDLFPGVMPRMVVTREGVAEVRGRER